MRWSSRPRFCGRASTQGVSSWQLIALVTRVVGRRAQARAPGAGPRAGAAKPAPCLTGGRAGIDRQLPVFLVTRRLPNDVRALCTRREHFEIVRPVPCACARSTARGVAVQVESQRRPRKWPFSSPRTAVAARSLCHALACYCWCIYASNDHRRQGLLWAGSGPTLDHVGCTHHLRLVGRPSPLYR